ncbi:MAG: integration host factor subunit beta [Planctomycetaceae bacterium]|jgi:nucleoid DNA-binding protein|nr:integration host factor subunit beta [Planctomycetaceae bacterium]
MTKKEIVRSIADSLGLSHKKTREIVQSTFDTVVETILEEGRVELRNFGVFEVKKRAARKAHNPKTGEEVNVPEKCVVIFKPGKFMEDRVAELAQKKKQ